ncbi:patatin-related protein [Kibdelosporangium banguiense]|uniref:Patatin-related protein n=1 Tax=Kibdelosporangium banguiense TaxID=1365924 RepID=A0ABS4TMA3_9PSEU|nr:patatin-like protein [Kibdelosporangium banguiense]MBP2325530.1 patatin-related protein [Kibdelosporangium banguiense]
MTDEYDPTWEEVRFAVVLNGGVSLAVWMGGVVLELDRLTRANDGYKHLLRLVGATARADVISGTSAGGINGAALALAQINPRADLNSLRELWAEQGRMDLLLRTPFKGAPVSLLKGDEFFLPRLEDAMRRLTARYEPRDVRDRPMDLRITTTLLQGTTRNTTDALGQRLTQNIHQGSFRFRRDDERDHFTEKGGLPPELTHQLALAARSSASFPVAFEPSYVPLGAGSPMREVASWADKRADRSQYVVDGGALVNTPTQEALEAIDQMPAEGPTRRVMLLVFPHAAAAGSDLPAQTTADQPSVLATVRAIMRAQSSQSNRTFVDEIEQYNRGAGARRGGRNALLTSLSSSGDPVAKRLYALVETLYPHYRDIRLRRAARKLAERQMIARAQNGQADPAGEAWSFERIRDAVEVAHRKWLEDHPALPYVPANPPVPGITEMGESGWPWDITTCERLAASALDMLKRLVWVLPKGSDIQKIHSARAAVHSARAQMRRMRLAMHKKWEEEPVDSPDGECWEHRLTEYNAQMTGEQGTKVRDLVLHVAEAFGAGAQVLAPAPAQRDPHLKAWQDFAVLSDEDPDASLPDAYRWMSRLLALEVSTTCLADESEAPEEQLVELAQISLQTENAFARYSITPDDKAGGYSLSRFSGFLKRSWRANDWIWGRMDAASMLCRVLLDPARIRRAVDLAGLLGQDPQTLARKVIDDLVTAMFGELPRHDRIEQCRDEAVGELVHAFKAKPGEALPATCPSLAELVGWSMHIRIVIEELPELRRAIAADAVDGANVRSNGERFVKQYAKLLDDLEELPPGQPLTPEIVEKGLRALEAFDRAGVGREPLGEEAASDQMIRTVATAAATAITLADSPQLGVKAARPVTRSLRGLTLLPYWTILGLTRGGRTARFLGQFGLAVGGLLLVLAMFGALPEWGETPGAAFGGAALLAAFGYSAVRTGSLVHGLVLLSPVVPLVAYGVTRTGSVQTGHGLAGLIGVGLFVAALLLLGSLPGTGLTPMGSAGKVITGFPGWLKSGKWIGPLVALAVAGTGVLIWQSGILGFLDDNRPVLLIATGAVLLLAAVLSYFGGRGLRTWHRHPEKGWIDPATRDPAAAAAGWAVVYGFLYVAIAIGLSFTAPATPFAKSWWAASPWWAAAAMATAIAFAAILLLVVPWYVPWRARAAIYKKLLDEATPLLYVDCGNKTKTAERLCERLEAHGIVCLGLAQRPNTDDEFKLTPTGRRLAARIHKRLNA